MKISLKFEPRDAWIGLYIDHKAMKLYICGIPFFPLILDFCTVPVNRNFVPPPKKLPNNLYRTKPPFNLTDRDHRTGCSAVMTNAGNVYELFGREAKT